MKVPVFSGVIREISCITRFAPTDGSTAPSISQICSYFLVISVWRVCGGGLGGGGVGVSSALCSRPARTPLPPRRSGVQLVQTRMYSRWYQLGETWLHFKQVARMAKAGTAMKLSVDHINKMITKHGKGPRAGVARKEKVAEANKKTLITAKKKAEGKAKRR